MQLTFKLISGRVVGELATCDDTLFSVASLTNAVASLGIPVGSQRFVTNGVKIGSWQQLRDYLLSLNVAAVTVIILSPAHGATPTTSDAAVADHPQQLPEGPSQSLMFQDGGLDLIQTCLPGLHSLTKSLAAMPEASPLSPMSPKVTATILSNPCIQQLSAYIQGTHSRLATAIQLISSQCRECLPQSCKVIEKLIKGHPDAFLFAINAFEGSAQPIATDSDLFLKRVDEGWDRESDTVTIEEQDESDDNEWSAFSPYRHDDPADRYFLLLHNEDLQRSQEGLKACAMPAVPFAHYSATCHTEGGINTAIMSYLAYLTRFVEGHHSIQIAAVMQVAKSLCMGLDAIISNVCNRYMLKGTSPCEEGSAPLLLSPIAMEKLFTYTAMAQHWFFNAAKGPLGEGDLFTETPVEGTGLISSSCVAWGAIMCVEVYRGLALASQVAHGAQSALHKLDFKNLNILPSHQQMSPVSLFVDATCTSELRAKLIAALDFGDTTLVRYLPMLSDLLGICPWPREGQARRSHHRYYAAVIGKRRGHRVAAMCPMPSTSTRLLLGPSGSEHTTSPLAYFESALRRSAGQRRAHRQSVLHHIRSMRMRRDLEGSTGPSARPLPQCPTTADCIQLWSSTMRSYYEALIAPVVEAAAKAGIPFLNTGSIERICFVVGDPNESSPPFQLDALEPYEGWSQAGSGSGQVVLIPKSVLDPSRKVPLLLPFAAMEGPTGIPLFAKACVWQTSSISRLLAASLPRTAAIGDTANPSPTSPVLALRSPSGLEWFSDTAKHNLGVDTAARHQQATAIHVDRLASGALSPITHTSGQWEKMHTTSAATANPIVCRSPPPERDHTSHRDRYGPSVSQSKESFMSPQRSESPPATDSPRPSIGTPVASAKRHAPHRGRSKTSVSSSATALFGSQQSIVRDPMASASALGSPKGTLPPPMVFGYNALSAVELLVTELYDSQLIQSEVGGAHWAVALPFYVSDSGNAEIPLVCIAGNSAMPSAMSFIPLLPRTLFTRVVDVNDAPVEGHPGPSLNLSSLDSDDETPPGSNNPPPSTLLSTFYDKISVSSSQTLAEAHREGMLAAMATHPHQPWAWASHALLHYGGSISSLTQQTKALAEERIPVAAPASIKSSPMGGRRAAAAVEEARNYDPSVVVTIMEGLLAGLLRSRPEGEGAVIDTLIQDLQDMAQAGPEKALFTVSQPSMAGEAAPKGHINQRDTIDSRPADTE